MEPNVLIGAKRMCELLDNCSRQHLWRLLTDEKYKRLKFPKPIKLRQRNYWLAGDVLAWIRDTARAAQPAE
jgi:predicted DNA-binding transcriptional regulator AlpA